MRARATLRNGREELCGEGVPRTAGVAYAQAASASASEKDPS